jgi:drug/metabolite transporter (DMT)-like permease
MNTSASLSMPSTPNSIRAAAAVAFTILSWAAAFPFIRLGLQGLTPMQLAAARFATAAVLVVGWLIYARPKRPSLRDSLLFVLSGFLGIASYNALLN